MGIICFERNTSNDEILAHVIKQSRVVLGQAAYWEELDSQDRPAVKKSVALLGPKPDRYLPQTKTLIRNNAIIEPVASGHGIFSLTAEPDGIVRRITSLFSFEDGLYPALSIEMLRVATGRPTILVKTNEAGVHSIGIAKGLEIPTDRQGRIWPYFSKSDKSKYISAKDVLANTVPPGKIRGKFMIVGTSAVGLLDIRAIPTEENIPGVEVHAQMIETALGKNYLTRPNYADAVEMALILFAGILMIWLVPVVGARWTMILFFVVAGGAGFGSWYAFIEHKMLFDAGFAIISILLLYTMLTYTGYAKEEAERRQVRTAFSHYLSPAMVEKLAEDPSQLKLGGETRPLTLLFCDVRGFTGLSEIYDAEGLTKLINRLLTPLTDVILKRLGTVDKYMGDCIMAFWNAPLDDPDHARNACLVALDMDRAMVPFNEGLIAEAEAEGRTHNWLQVGIGLNSGEVVVGNMGSDQRFDYSVLGDAVNLAARLEGQSKNYGVRIVLGEATKILVPDMATIELDLIQVKGKTEAVRVFALLGDDQDAQGNAFKAISSANEEMLATYRAQDWVGARKAIEACRSQLDGYELGGLYDLYEERVTEFEANPPDPDWDDVFVAETKWRRTLLRRPFSTIPIIWRS